MQLFDDQTNFTGAESECAALVIETVLVGMRTVRREMRSGLPVDVSVPQFRVLAHLKRHEGASLSHLAEHMGLTLPSMSKAVDALVKRDLVRRETSQNDRRCITLALTPSGLQAFQAAADATKARIAERLAVLTPEERSAVSKAMEILRPILAPRKRCAR